MYLVFVIILALHSTSAQSNPTKAPSNAKYIGSLYNKDYGVSGQVFGVITPEHDAFIHIENFSFRGNCSEPVFIASSISREPEKNQFVYLPYSGSYADPDTKYLKNEPINNAYIRLNISNNLVSTFSINWLAFWCDRGGFFMGTVQFQHYIGRLVGGGFSGNVFTHFLSAIFIENYTQPDADEEFKFVAVSESGSKSEGSIPYKLVICQLARDVIEMHYNFNFSDVTLVHVENATGKIVAITQREQEHQEDTGSWWDLFWHPFSFLSGFSS